MVKNKDGSYVMGVTKRELDGIIKDFYFVDISKKDKKIVESYNGDGYIGFISGDVQNIKKVPGVKVSKRPRCKFNIDKELMYVVSDVVEKSKPVETKRARKVENFGFGNAIKYLKDGKKVARTGWNGKGMFLFLVNSSNFVVSRPPLLGIYKPGTEVTYSAHIDMKTADGSIVPWLASQTDVLAEDWMLVK
jgi:hypothetical protein